MASVIMYSLYLLLCVCCLGLNAAKISLPHALENPEEHFEQFIQKYGKQYADEKEKQARFEIFVDNLIAALIQNEKSTHAEFGITQFMDLTEEEFLNGFTGLNLVDNRLQSDLCTMLSDDDIEYVNAPESWDWREQGVVTAVKSQNCGDCYAFGSTGNIESQYAIKHGELPILSQQQIVDCDKRNGGCGGGWMTYAFSTIIEMGGIQAEPNYPYQGKVEQCHFDANNVKVQLSACNAFDLRSQEKLKQLVYKTGPITVAVTATKFNLYTRGVMSDEECGTTDINHSVLIVGYGEENGKPYWLVKNSWDTTFGENGYIKFERGDNHTSCMVMNPYMATAIVV